MNIHNLIPLGIFHIMEGLVSQNTRVVNYDIDPTIGVNSRLDNGLAVFSRSSVTDGFTAIPYNLVNDVVRVHKIIYDDGGTIFGKKKRI